MAKTKKSNELKHAERICFLIALGMFMGSFVVCVFLIELIGMLIDIAPFVKTILLVIAVFLSDRTTRYFIRYPVFEHLYNIRD